MTLTKDQLTRLMPYESYFKSAIDSGWSRYPGRTAINEIWSIYTEATGDKRPQAFSCNTCVLQLLIDCGKMYFADAQEWARKQKKKKK